MSDQSPYHAHIYYSIEERAAAEGLRQKFLNLTGSVGKPNILFVGQMADRGIGPHPLPQYEVHFVEEARADVVAMIEETGLRALVHPLTDDDLADHTSLARWIGEPLALDLTVLDPPGRNQGVPRFGKSDF